MELDKLSGAIEEKRKIAKMIKKIQNRLDSGVIDVYGFYDEIRLLKDDLENGII